jgi:predicted SprT family Zn-dependent metalloprotease
VDLGVIFDQINLKHFDGFLDRPVLRWNSRLRTCAGRFFPGRRVLDLSPVIEVASYLKNEPDAETHVRETMAHEMIHYWLWVRRRPYGHTEEFLAKMNQMGARRYNPVPMKRPYKYLYQCSHCAMIFKVRRRLGLLACAKCCRRFSGGRFDQRFVLIMAYDLSKNPEAIDLVAPSSGSGSRE